MSPDSWNNWRDEQLNQALAKVASLQQYRDWITQNVRGALGIRAEGGGSDTAVISGVLGGFGAHPGQYQPVISLDLATVRTVIEALPQGHDLPTVPTSGLLKLTASPDEAALTPDDPKRIRTSFEADERLGDRADDPKGSVRFTLTPVLTLPSQELVPSPPAKDLFEDWSQLEHLLTTSDHQILGHLFGWPRWSTLAYDPRPDATWLTLLGLMSDESHNLLFGDGDWLMVFIEPDALAGADFGHLATDEG